jgi:hypothetical protein
MVVQEKMMSLIGELLQATEKGGVQWEGTPSENVFRAWIGDGCVKLKESRGLGDNGTEDCVSLWVLNADDETVDRLELSPAQDGYAQLQQLFALARRKSRKADQVLDQMLKVLRSNK